VEYGPDLLDLLAQGVAPKAALDRLVAADADRERRQVGVIEALAAGHALGGDGRHGETQSAAVLVADPRPGMSRRPDGQTVNINVCEHPEPVAELRRIYDTASETLGFRTLEQPIGRDVLQLKILLHALGFFRPGDREVDVAPARRSRSCRRGPPPPPRSAASALAIRGFIPGC
jgi:uncharacterized Ntn-hydrolase superfamily protein